MDKVMISLSLSSIMLGNNVKAEIHTSKCTTLHIYFSRSHPGNTFWIVSANYGLFKKYPPTFRGFLGCPQIQ